MPIALLLLILCSEMGIMSIRKRGDSECVDKCEDVRKKKTISFGFEETTGYYGLVVTFDMQIPRTRVAPLAHPDTRVKPDNNPGCEWFVLFFFCYGTYHENGPCFRKDDRQDGYAQRRQMAQYIKELSVSLTSTYRQHTFDS